MKKCEHVIKIANTNITCSVCISSICTYNFKMYISMEVECMSVWK